MSRDVPSDSLQVGVAMASAAELSFNWTGFISAMISNLTFGFRAVLGKKCAAACNGRPLCAIKCMRITGTVLLVLLHSGDKSVLERTAA